MGLIDSIKNRYEKNTKFVDPRVRICVECGSTDTEVYGKYVTCKECKKVRHYKIKPSRFYPGDLVRIVDPEKNSEIIYKIKKIKKSKQGTVVYELKSQSNNKDLIYYEGTDSRLERVIESKINPKKKKTN